MIIPLLFQNKTFIYEGNFPSFDSEGYKEIHVSITDQSKFVANAEHLRNHGNIFIKCL